MGCKCREKKPEPAQEPETIVFSQKPPEPAQPVKDVDKIIEKLNEITNK